MQGCNLLQNSMHVQECVRVQMESREQHWLSVPRWYTFTLTWLAGYKASQCWGCRYAPACQLYVGSGVLLRSLYLQGKQCAHRDFCLDPLFFPGIEINPVLEHARQALCH